MAYVHVTTSGAATAATPGSGKRLLWHGFSMGNGVDGVPTEIAFQFGDGADRHYRTFLISVGQEDGRVIDPPHDLAADEALKVISDADGCDVDVTVDVEEE